MGRSATGTFVCGYCEDKGGAARRAASPSFLLPDGGRRILAAGIAGGRRQ